MEKICVAVRMRPPAPEETPSAGGTHWRWKVEDNRISLHKPLGTPTSSNLSFAFDHVFDESCSNATVYELLTKDIILAAVEGFNGTAFAYGQTSSGKTFTMIGSQTDPGIIHRAVRDVFNNIEMICDREFLVRVSYMEIYNEEINDLLAVENQKLQIHESLERGIFVAGLREEIVSSAEQVFHLLQLGEVNRHFGETNMNARSSRSHTIFRMVIESKGKDTSFGDHSSGDAIRVSVLNLVDLAGSERIAKTGAGGVRLKEGKHINKSLMVLGNVINKLSDGAKQRGHIPYRDSKLTRILQPALGGNAKTSIICTIAPEEVHVEETKGTLQFASRAKRITNCAQVNEILTDAALLKRQKLEIEELRKKLRGSRAEVLEQEVLKLRNEMLQYEQEREKLEMELEEERRSHKESDQCIREQQKKIENLSSLVTFPDSDGNPSQNSGRQNLKGEFNDSTSISQEDIFESPCFKPAPNAFVVKRSNYPKMPEYSPIPDSFSNVADEDTWLKMNKGFIADLDSLQVTSAKKMQSFPSGDMTTVYSSGHYRKEIQNLKREMEIVMEEKQKILKQNSDLLLLNDRLMEKIAKLEREASLVREIPGRVCQSVGKCKDIYKDALSTLQRTVPDGQSSAAILLSGISEIGINLLSSLEKHLTTAVDSEKYIPWNTSLVQEQCKALSETLQGTVRFSVSSETLTCQSKRVRNQTSSCDHKDCTLGGETSSCKENLNNNLNSFKDQCNGVEKKLDHSNRLLEVSREKYSSLEKDFQLLRKERDTLLETVSESSKKLALVTEQKKIVQKDLLADAQRRKYLEEEIKQFSIALASRQRSVMNFHGELRATIEKLTGENPVTLSKPLGY